MNRFFLLILTMVSLSLGFNSKSMANTDGNRAAPIFEWRGNACGEFTPGGDLIQWVDRKICKNLVGYKTMWNKKLCVEVTPKNVLIQELADINVCRCSVGTTYNMSGDSCGEFTSEGTLLRWFDSNIPCLRDSGLIKRRCHI